MELRYALTLLLLPVALTWLWWRREFVGPFRLGFGRLLAIVLLVAYVVAVLLLGVESVAGIKRFSFDHLERILDAFLFPGVAFSIILFPAVFATLFGKATSFSEPWVFDLFAVVGWLILGLLSLQSLLWIV